MYEHHHASSGPAIEKLPNDALMTAVPGAAIDPAAMDFMIPVEYTRDGKLITVTEMWRKRDTTAAGASGAAAAAGDGGASTAVAEGKGTGSDDDGIEAAVAAIAALTAKARSAAGVAHA